jgi:hypothetical protein
MLSATGISGLGPNPRPEFSGFGATFLGAVQIIPIGERREVVESNRVASSGDETPAWRGSAGMTSNRSVIRANGLSFNPYAERACVELLKRTRTAFNGSDGDVTPFMGDATSGGCNPTALKILRDGGLHPHYEVASTTVPVERRPGLLFTFESCPNSGRESWVTKSTSNFAAGFILNAGVYVHVHHFYVILRMNAERLVCSFV